jgi:hypothetical protein
MTDFFRSRSQSLSMVVLVLVGILLLQGGISYSTTFGSLDRCIKIPGVQHGAFPTVGLVLRVASLLAVTVLWILNRKRDLFKAIVVFNGMLTFGLLVNMTAFFLSGEASCPHYESWESRYTTT